MRWRPWQIIVLSVLIGAVLSLWWMATADKDVRDTAGAFDRSNQAMWRSAGDALLR
jgi:hypothetical protein